MPNVFFCVKSAPRATAEERSTSRVDDLFFSASVEAPPTRPSEDPNKVCRDLLKIELRRMQH